MTLPTTTDGPTSSTGPVLGFLQHLLEAGQPETLSAILEGLARAFAVDGAGWLFPWRGEPKLSQAAWLASPVITYPWEEKPEVLERLQKVPTSLALDGAAGSSWLVTSVGGLNGSCFGLWLASREPRSWTAADMASLALAGDCLVRHLSSAGEKTPWLEAFQRSQLQEHIDQTARTTTRLAHDFGNILTSILGFAELTLPQLKQDSTSHRFIGEVLETARQGARWVQKLQLFSRRFQPKFIPTSLHSLLQEEESRSQWRGGVALKVNLPAQLPPVALDGESLRQVLGNLLDNAREAMTGMVPVGMVQTGTGIVQVSGQVVSLAAEDCLELLGNNRPGPHVELTISDSGAGLPAGLRDHLCRELFSSTKGRRRGLGLAVVYGILHSFQAGFRLSPGPGKGTTIQVYLPVAAKQVVEAPLPSAPAPAGAHILVVDDDPQILPVLCRTLEGAGYRVQPASGSEDALTQFSRQEDPFNLILTDVVMPGPTGLEMAQRMQKLDAGANFLFISSKAHQDPLLSQFPFLSKPFEPSALLQAVRKALLRKSPHRPGKKDR